MTSKSGIMEKLECLQLAEESYYQEDPKKKVLWYLVELGLLFVSLDIVVCLRVLAFPVNKYGNNIISMKSPAVLLITRWLLPRLKGKLVK